MDLTYIAAAYLCGLTARFLFLPPLVGYLLAGYVLYMLGVRPNPAITELSHLGIQLLLFSVGLKLKLSSLIRREVLSVGVSHLLLVTAVSALIFLFLGHHISGGLVLGVSLAFSSTVFALKVLEDNGELSTLHGRDVLSILIMQDIVAVALLALTGDMQPTPWASALLLIPLLRPLAHRVLSFSQFEELKLLLGILMALAGGQLAEKLGVSADLGALLMGVLLAGHTDTEALSERMWGMKEIFLIAFFLQIGLNELPDYDALIDALSLLVCLPAQGLLFFVLFLLAGLRARTAFVSSLALMTYSEFALITSHSVVAAGLLPESWITTISLAVAASLAIAAPLNYFSHPLFSRLEPFLTRFERSGFHPDHLPVTTGASEWIIIGMGRTGLAAYEALEKQGFRVLGMDADPTIFGGQQTKGRRIIYGDAEDPELWESLRFSRLKGFLLTYPDFNARRRAIRKIRGLEFEGLVGAIAFSAEEEAELKSCGADLVINPLAEAGGLLADRIRLLL